MLLQPVDYFLVVWFVLAAASTLYVGIDQYRNNPEPVVMKWGFILVTLYMGPLGLLLYVLADKEPRPGEHEDFTKPLWKQGVGSTIHCVAGDATGIILAAVIIKATSGPKLPVAVHEIHDGRHLLGERPQELPAGIYFHELYDGRHGAGHELPDDGP